MQNDERHKAKDQEHVACPTQGALAQGAAQKDKICQSATKHAGYAGVRLDLLRPSHGGATPEPSPHPPKSANEGAGKGKGETDGKKVHAGSRG
jgi:hypothetical protein